MVQLTGMSEDSSSTCRPDWETEKFMFKRIPSNCMDLDKDVVLVYLNCLDNF